MANLSSFFGQAQGSGTVSGVITDPRKLPVMGARWNHAYFKYTANNYDADNSVQFWNAMGFQCDTQGTNLQITTENTWHTHVDYSGGAGRLYYCVGPSTPGMGYESWLRITVDGTAYTFKKQNLSLSEAASFASGGFVPTVNAPSHDRIFWGSFTDLPQTGSGYNSSPNSYYEHGEHRYDPATYWGSRPDKYGVRSPNQYVGVLPVSSMMKANFDYVKFDNSLKVEYLVTTGGLSSATTYSPYCGTGWTKEITVEI